MIRWLKRILAWWHAPACPGAKVVTNGDAQARLNYVREYWRAEIEGRARSKADERTRSLSMPTPVTDWDIAQRFEQVEPEPGRVEYRFLGVTGEEDA